MINNLYENNIKRFILIIKALLISFTFTASGDSVVAERGDYVSMLNLIANAEKYNEKLISVVGFLKLDFENKALYLSSIDSENRITKNAIWVDIKISKANLAYKNQYVFINGIFSSKKNGHFSLYSGSIESIKEISVWKF